MLIGSASRSQMTSSSVMVLITMNSIAISPISACSNPRSMPHRSKNRRKSKRIVLPALLTAWLLIAWLLTLLIAQPGYAQAPGEDVRSYTVAPGDTLFVIAQQFGVPLETLIAYNGLSDPNQLEIGQVLLIPVGDAADAPAAGDATGDAAADAAGGLAAADLAVTRA